MTPSPRTPRFTLSGLLLTAALALGSMPAARAHVNSGANCASCHSSSRSGMSVTDAQSVTNLGAGLRKVFQITPGQTAAIGIQVTDGHSQYGLALVNLDGGGVLNSANHLTYQADSSWTKRTAYYSVGPSSSNKSWTFRLGVSAATPPDFYLLRLRMAGTGGGRWGQEEAFYVQVLKPTPTAPQITDPSWAGGVFTCRVATTAGFTYHLEARDQAAAGAWNVVAQITGDGATKALTDATAGAAGAASRVYRLRVE